MRKYKEFLKGEFEKRFTDMTLTLRKIFRSEVSYLSGQFMKFRDENVILRKRIKDCYRLLEQ